MARQKQSKRWSVAQRFGAACFLTSVLLLGLGGGCAHGVVVVSDPCPLPREEAVGELLASGAYGSLWFRRMTLWCESLEQ